MRHNEKRYAKDYERQAQALAHRDGAKEVPELGIGHANELEEKAEYAVEHQERSHEGALRTRR